MKRLILFLLLGSLIGGCGFPTSVTSAPVPPNVVLTDTSTPVPPTPSPTPTATATMTPPPDLSEIGLPSEPAGILAFDFVDQMCAAEWYVQDQLLPCPGDPEQTASGYVMRLEGGVKGVPSGFPMMLTYPPLGHYSKMFSKYPPFTVQKGDRFRAVIACRAHMFCDVEFYLNFFSDNGERYLQRWHYLFTDAPIVIDYSLDSLAGRTVQFDLAVVAITSQPEMEAVWIAPHIYRPIHE
jgi:hypothetical protein